MRNFSENFAVLTYRMPVLSLFQIPFPVLAKVRTGAAKVRAFYGTARVTKSTTVRVVQFGLDANIRVLAQIRLTQIQTVTNQRDPKFTNFCKPRPFINGACKAQNLFLVQSMRSMGK